MLDLSSFPSSMRSVAMVPITSRELLDLGLHALAERLLKLADEARADAVAGDVLALGAMRDALRAASDGASGASLSLLEVAAAFVEALARTDLSPAELAVRAFCVRHPEDAATIFGALLADDHLDARELARLSADVRAHVAVLVDRGVVRQGGRELTIEPRFLIARTGPGLSRRSSECGSP